jgi:sugar/nucleoside kinase (ribokinase family)
VALGSARFLGQLPPICVIGNLNTDLIVRGVRSLPGWGNEVEGVDHTFVSSGQAGYLAQALSRLGVRVRLIGIVGRDTAGRSILADLRAAGVDTGAVDVSGAAVTGITVAIVRPDGERAFVSDAAALRDLDERRILGHWQQAVAPVVCLVGLNNLPSLTLGATHRLLVRAHAEGLLTVLDYGWDPGQWPPATVRGLRAVLREVDVFLPNLEEARVLTGHERAEDAAAALVDDGARVVVVKRGADGSHARMGDQTFSAPAFPVTVHDAVGAGDAFNAGFLCGYLPARDVESGLRLGSAVAALYVSRAADRFPSLDEALALTVSEPAEATSARC